MCGIFALLNNDGIRLSPSYIEEEFMIGKKRGPEFSKLSRAMVGLDFGFHRLAINGLNDISHQPIQYNNITLICNGEIYNYKKLYEMMEDVFPHTDSDCEVIIHLYLKYGIDQTLQMLDGVFAFCLLDNTNPGNDAKLYVARDPYGVRPLYIMKPLFESTKKNVDNIYGFASELKVLCNINERLNVENRIKNDIWIFEHPSFTRKHPHFTIEQFVPGTYNIFSVPCDKPSNWTLTQKTRYHLPGFRSCLYNNNSNVGYIIPQIQSYLKSAVEKRCVSTERPIACLLSGGLDSSLITALVNEYHTKHNLPKLETYSIGLDGSEDLKNAKIVAEYLGTNHTEIVLTEQAFLDAIPDVIESIESYDTTTVRASIGNWLIGKYISEHSEAKVIFNGDGADELMGGYLYAKYAPCSIEFDRECRRLLKDIHTFDVLRSDKSISSHGLEPRTPFLDRAWVDFYLSLPHDIRFHGGTDKMEKYLVRTAFSERHYKTEDGKQILPEGVLYRRKEAFSDGVSKQTRSLYEIIQEHTKKMINPLLEKNLFDDIEDDNDTIPSDVLQMYPGMTKLRGHLLPTTTEQLYYRQLFEKHYSGYGEIVPYFWMPKYIDANDSSARTLPIYNAKRVDEE